MNYGGIGMRDKVDNCKTWDKKKKTEEKEYIKKILAKNHLSFEELSEFHEQLNEEREYYSNMIRRIESKISDIEFLQAMLLLLEIVEDDGDNNAKE